MAQMIATPNAQGMTTRIRESLIWVSTKLKSNPDAAVLIALTLASVALAAWKIATVTTKPAGDENLSPVRKENENIMLNVQPLIDARDKLNADIATLIAATNVDQGSVDQVAADAVTLDNKVVTLLQAAPPPSTLDFSKFDQAVNKLTENIATLKAPVPPAGLTQATVDSLTAALETANTALLTALGVQ
jgi:hypothetical protein